MSGLENMTPPWERCECAKQVGEMAVYVTPACPMMHFIRGKMAVTKRECRRCDKDGRKTKTKM